MNVEVDDRVSPHRGVEEEEEKLLLNVNKSLFSWCPEIIVILISGDCLLHKGNVFGWKFQEEKNDILSDIKSRGKWHKTESSSRHDKRNFPFREWFKEDCWENGKTNLRLRQARQPFKDSAQGEIDQFDGFSLNILPLPPSRQRYRKVKSKKSCVGLEKRDSTCMGCFCFLSR